MKPIRYYKLHVPKWTSRSLGGVRSRSRRVLLMNEKKSKTIKVYMKLFPATRQLTIGVYTKNRRRRLRRLLPLQMTLITMMSTKNSRGAMVNDNFIGLPNHAIARSRILRNSLASMIIVIY